MKLLIEFPYGMHWKTKAKFLTEYKCTFSIQPNGELAKEWAILETEDVSEVLETIISFKFSSIFSKFGISFWELKKPPEWDVISQANKIDYILEPRKCYGEIEAI